MTAMSALQYEAKISTGKGSEQSWERWERLYQQPRQKSRKDKGELRKWEERDLNCVKFGACKVPFLFTWLMLPSKDFLICMWE